MREFVTLGQVQKPISAKEEMGVGWFRRLAAIWLLSMVGIAPTDADAQVLTTGCPLTLSPEVGGFCDYFNNVARDGGITLRFGLSGTGVSLSIENDGNVIIRGTVETTTGGSADAIYRFSVRDVRFRNFGDRIDVACDAGNCIHVSGKGLESASIIGTTLVVNNPSEETNMRDAFNRLKQLFPT